MDKIETTFLQILELQPLVWFRYSYSIFFICTHGEQELQTFLRSLIEFHADIRFTLSQAKKAFLFLTLKLVLKIVRLLQICM